MRGRPGQRRWNRRAGQGRNPLTSLCQSRNERGQRDVKSRSRFLVGETSQNDDQQRLSQLQRKGANCGRHPDLARARVAVGAFHILVPCRVPLVEGQPTNMSAMQSNKLGKRAHARIVPWGSVHVVWNARADRFERSLPEQAIDERGRRRMIKNEPVVSRQGHAESAEVREVGQAVA
jgi:hypothetical protein